MQRMGMNFVGVIKNSTANYPKKWLQDNAFNSDSKRGDVLSLHSLDQYGRRLIAHA